MVKYRPNEAILFERQEEGSMLCAQHALNNLLQQSVFSPSELAEIAKGLDAAEMEQLYDTNTNNTTNGDNTNAADDNNPAGGSSSSVNVNRDKSRNMDDSGYFSSQVMDEALKLFGLRMVYWESPELDAWRDRPELQNGFIFNNDRHWYSIRRFDSTPDLFVDLNSFLESPERVGSMYLGLKIDEARKKNYTVFAILPRQQSDSAYGPVLPECPADSCFPLFTREDDDQDLQRPYKRARSNPTPTDGEEGEDQLLARAIEESLRQPGEVVTPPESNNIQASSSKLNTEQAQSIKDTKPEPEQEPAQEQEQEEEQIDEPSMDELRRRRLERFS